MRHCASSALKSLEGPGTQEPGGDSRSRAMRSPGYSSTCISFAAQLHVVSPTLLKCSPFELRPLMVASGTTAGALAPAPASPPMSPPQASVGPASSDAPPKANVAMSIVSCGSGAGGSRRASSTNMSRLMKRPIGWGASPVFVGSLKALGTLSLSSWRPKTRRTAPSAVAPLALSREEDEAPVMGRSSCEVSAGSSQALAAG
mmetsp:Transcript_96414/g.281757  ORF Transcript_96414/g.281757 Transcript_96414/m.281757 type:complete len:202 (+) Transcript_96414:24-629(+)